MFAAAGLNLDLGEGRGERLLDAYLQIAAFPEARPVLTALKDAGLRLAFLSNLTRRMLDRGIESAGLQGQGCWQRAKEESAPPARTR